MRISDLWLPLFVPKVCCLGGSPGCPRLGLDDKIRPEVNHSVLVIGDFERGLTLLLFPALEAQLPPGERLEGVHCVEAREELVLAHDLEKRK